MNQVSEFLFLYRFQANVKHDVMSDKLLQGVDEEACREGNPLYKIHFNFQSLSIIKNVILFYYQNNHIWF